MPITAVQQGVIGQFIAAILMMMGSNGKLEVAVPMSDDDRRDQEVHARGVFGKALALQIKNAMQLYARPHLLAPLYSARPRQFRTPRLGTRAWPKNQDLLWVGHRAA